MYYQSESISITQTDGTSAFIVTSQSLGIQEKIERNTNMRLGKFRPQAYLGTSKHPTTEVTLEYIPTGQLIETILGLKGPTQVIDYLVVESSGKKNFAMNIYARDLTQEQSNKTTVKLESGVLTQYSFQAGVQSQPKVSINASFTDMAIDNTSAVSYPVYDEKTPLPRNYDIYFNIPTGIIGVKQVVPQQISISIPLNRETVHKIGQSKAYQRNLQAPVIASVQINAIVETDEQIGNGSFNGAEMSKLKKGVWVDDVLTATVYKPIENGESPTALITFRANKPYLDNISWSQSVGQYKNIQLSFLVPISFENGDELQNLKIY